MPRIEDLIAIAIAAGTEVLAVYASDFPVTIKPDSTPLTEADLRAEALILARLRALAPEIPVVAEEDAAAGRPPPVADRFFLVDPLDGSREFIARNGEFTVNIALIENGAPTMGVVHAPALEKIWWGTAAGAYSGRVENGAVAGKTRLQCRPSESGGLRVVGSRSHGSPELDAYLSTIAVADFQAAGSSLKFCMLAEGQADLYPRFGRTMEWDTAAGDAVLRAAGGSVRTLDATLLSYGKRDRRREADFANPFFIARGHPDPIPEPEGHGAGHGR